MFSLETALVISAIAALLVSASCFYLATVSSLPYLRFWGAAFILNAARYGFSYATTTGTLASSSASEICITLAIACLWLGSRLDRHRSLHPLGAVILVTALLGWIGLAPLLAVPRLIYLIPPYTVPAVILALIGWSFIRRDASSPNRGHILVGAFFILRALHLANYPYLRDIPSIAPFGFMIGALLDFTIGLGLLVSAQRDATIAAEQRAAELTEENRRRQESETALLEANELLAKQAVDLEHLAQMYQTQREEALTASRAKSNFLANMSHELRTPLNAIIGFSDLLAMTNRPLDDASRSAYAGDIQSSSRRLLRKINDILDFASLDANNYEVRMAPVSLQSLLETCILDAQPLAETRRIAIKADVPANLPVLELDHHATRKALSHILDNAIRFTPVNGIIRIYVTLIRDRQLTITVQDGGPGITREDLQLVANPFWQAEPILTKRHGGIGLGLPLSRRLIEIQGGTLDIASHIGVGTRVTLRFPVAQAGEPQQLASA